jgi:hypothetical protein
MTSMTLKRVVAVVTVAGSLVIGGASFASASTGVVAGNNPTGVIGDAYAVAASTLTDANQSGGQPTDVPRFMGDNPVGLIGDAYAVVVSTLTDVGRRTR